MLQLIYKRNTMRLINNRYVNASYSKKNKAFSLRLHALCFFSYDALTYLLLICSIVFLLYCTSALLNYRVIHMTSSLNSRASILEEFCKSRIRSYFLFQGHVFLWCHFFMSKTEIQHVKLRNLQEAFTTV